MTSTTFPSFNWMRGVSDDTAITPIHRLVLMRLCLHRRADNGQCAPGYDPVATELGVDRATIFRAVNAGIKRGWIAPRADHGGRTLAHFALTFPPGQPSPGGHGSAPQSSRPCNGSEDPTVAAVQLNRRTSATQPSQPNLEVSDIAGEFGPNGRLYGRLERGNKTLSPDSASPRVKKTDAKAQAGEGKERRGKVDVAEVGFGAFWSAYPKRVEEAAALKAFIAAVEQGVDPQVLLSGAQRYAIERAEKNPDYTKHPATWLNKGCWTDETSGPTVIDEAGNIIAFAARRDEPEPTEAEIRREWGLHSRADEMLLRERGYGRA
jgi:hypothetical protein